MFEFLPVTIEAIKEIGNWRYEGFVKSVYIKPYLESIKENKRLKGPDGCEGYVALKNNMIAGLFEFYFENDIMEIGLALNPDLVGKGFGSEFIREGIFFGLKAYNYKRDYIRLTVNEKNKPAIKVYKKVGFDYYKKNDDLIEMRMTVNGPLINVDF